MKKKCILGLLAFANGSLTQAQNGLNMFNETVMHEIKVTTAFPDLVDTLFFHYNEDQEYTLCDVVIDGTSLDSVGIKFKGNFSAWACPNDKLPVKFDFSEYHDNRKYDGLKKINLANGFKDPTLMRDALSYRILRRAGVPAPRTSYAKLFFNGVYVGLYVVVEELDKKFLDMNYPDKNGNMYKCNGSDLEWEGPLKNDYVDNFEQSLKRGDDSSFADLIHFHDIINNSGSSFEDSLRKNFNTTYFFRSIAIDYLTANWDNVLGHGRNFSLYHSTTDDKFYWIPWDYNLGFSDYVIDITWSGLAVTPLWSKCMSIPALKNEYLWEVCSINANLFTNTNFEAYIDSLKTLIRPAYVLDPNAFYTGADFDNNIVNTTTVMEMDMFGGTWPTSYPGLKSSISTRHALAQTELDALGFNCVASLSEEPFMPLWYGFPNPFDESVTLHLATTAPSVITLYDTQGKPWSKTVAQGSDVTLDVERLPAGLYFALVEVNQSTHVIKLIKQ